MELSVTLLDTQNGINDVVVVKGIEDKHHFEYLDNDNNLCRIDVYNDGIELHKTGLDHDLELCLRKNAFAIIKTQEGDIKIDAKVVDFIQNDVILVMHYLVDDQLKQITINYRS